MNAPLPRPPELHGVLPPALASAVETAQQVADARLSYLLEPGCPRDTFHHDIRALYTLVRINKTLTDYCLRHPEPPADPRDPSADPEPNLTPDSPASSVGADLRVRPSSPNPSALSDRSDSRPPDSASHSSHSSHRSHASFSSVKSAESVDDSAVSFSSSNPASPTQLLSPLLVRLLDRAERDLGHHMETHMLSRGLDRPALFPADVERLAALVSVRVTLAEVDARAPQLPEGAFNAWLALALDAGALGKHPWDPSAKSPELEKLLEKERREIVAANEKAFQNRLAENERDDRQDHAARLADDFLADVHRDPAPPADALTSDDSPSSTCPSHASDLTVSDDPVGADLRVRPASDPTLGDDSEFRGRHGGLSRRSLGAKPEANSEAGPSESVQSVDSAGHGEASQRNRVDGSSSLDASVDVIPADTARAAVEALLDSAGKSFDALHRRAGRLAREPHHPPFFHCVPESAFAVAVDRAEPLPAAAPAPEPSLTDGIHLVRLSARYASPRHRAEIPADTPADVPAGTPSSYPSYRSYPSHSEPQAETRHSLGEGGPRQIQIAPALSAFPKDLKRHVLDAPVDAADLTSRASAAAARWIFHTVTDALFLLLRHIHRSIGHPTRPPTPFSRPYLSRLCNLLPP